jgi:hypothetical protein
MEYMFVISLILVVCITTIGELGQQLKGLFGRDATTIGNATTSAVSGSP